MLQVLGCSSANQRIQVESATKSPNAPIIIRFDPRFDQLVPRDAVVEKIADGFAWVEGPVWYVTATALCQDRPLTRLLLAFTRPRRMDYKGVLSES